MFHRIFATVLSALLLAIAIPPARAEILITLSNPNDSTTFMTIEMDSVDISSITSAATLNAVLGTAADYTQITSYFPTTPSSVTVRGPYDGGVSTLPITTFDSTNLKFTATPNGYTPWNTSDGSAWITGQASSIYVQTTTGTFSNQFTINGTSIDGVVTAVTSAPEPSTLIFASIGIASYLAGSGLRRWARRKRMS